MTHNRAYVPPSEQRLLSRFWQSARGFLAGKSACWAWVLTALGASNWFTDNYTKLAEWAASASRVASLLLALDQVDQPTTEA